MKKEAEEALGYKKASERSHMDVIKVYLLQNSIRGAVRSAYSVNLSTAFRLWREKSTWA